MVLDNSFREVFPHLFAITDNENARVAEVWSTNGWRPMFRRMFGIAETAEWQNLQLLLHDITLSPGRDQVSWKLESSGQFSTGSLYREIFRAAPSIDLSGIWKAKIPAKIKIFLWQMARNRIPSGDQVRKRHGPGDGKCPWCGMDEDSDQILF